MKKTKILEKIEPINKLLQNRFDLSIDVTTEQHLKEVHSHYIEKRENLLKTLGESKALQSPTYAKAFLISEAAHMILREIAPRRMRKKTSNKK